MNSDSVLSWKAPVAATISLTFKWKRYSVNSDGVSVSVWKNAATLWTLNLMDTLEHESIECGSGCLLTFY